MKTVAQLEDLFLTCHDDACTLALIADAGKTDNAFVSYHDREGKYIAASDGITTMMSYIPNELKGRSAYDFIHPDDFEEILRSHARVTLQTGVSAVTYRLKDKQGIFHLVTTLSKPIVNLKQGIQEILALTFFER